MHKYLFLLSLFSFIYIANSQDLKLDWQETRKKNKAKAVGLFSKKYSPGTNSSVPGNTTLKDVCRKNYAFEWKPSWRYKGLGGVLLPYALQSDDQTVWGLVETLPQKDADASSIIVFFNLYNMKIANYLVMDGKNVRSFCYVPFSKNIVCLVKSPYDKYFPKDKYQFFTMDTSNGSVVSKSAEMKEKISSICASPDGKSLYAAIPASNLLRVYDIYNLNQEYKTVKTIKSPLAIKLSFNGKKLLVCGKNAIQYFTIHPKLLPEKTISLPNYYTPDKLVICSNDGEKFLISSNGDDTYYYNGKKFIKILKRTAADIGWSRSGKRLILPTTQKSNIEIINPETPDEVEKEFRFQRPRPTTKSALMKLIPLPKYESGFGILDQKGILMKLYPVKRRWKKTIIVDEPAPL